MDHGLEDSAEPLGLAVAGVVRNMRRNNMITSADTSIVHGGGQSAWMTRECANVRRWA